MDLLSCEAASAQRLATLDDRQGAPLAYGRQCRDSRAVVGLLAQNPNRLSSYILMTSTMVILLVEAAPTVSLVDFARP